VSFKQTDGRVLVLDYVVGDVDEISHLIDDDVFLSECLAGLDSQLAIKTSPGSARNVASKLKVHATALGSFGWLGFSPRLQRLVRLLAVRPGRDVTDVVFTVFEELPTLLFMLLHPRRRVHLIFHNNLSLERKQRHPRLYPMLIKAVAKRASSLMVSSQHQVGLLKQIYPAVQDSKIVEKPHHILGYSRTRLPLLERSNRLLYLGPVSIRKPVEPVIDLIKADVDGKFRYVMKNMVGITEEQKRYLESHPNVDFSTEFLNDGAFYEAIGSAALLISTHNRLFEGKLSGPISDAIASGTPVIANRMSPHDEMFDEFGDMGYLVDYDDPRWVQQVLSIDLQSDYDTLEPHMALCRENSSMENMREIFRVRFES
jgi:glycosyltransferase involved in cell wall biosynthesis